jgi:hypothetical protein
MIFRVTYRLQAHNIRKFENILLNEIMPLVQELGIRLPAIWKSFVGEAGEFMELWEFESISDFEQKWRQLTAHPQLEEIFKVTGPMVENESFSLFEPLRNGSDEDPFDIKHYSV